ncbi:hypothetical protein U1Q18_023664 [Sarracenia purpurea var. burkii]
MIQVATQQPRRAAEGSGGAVDDGDKGGAEIVAHGQGDPGEGGGQGPHGEGGLREEKLHHAGEAKKVGGAKEQVLQRNPEKGDGEWLKQMKKKGDCTSRGCLRFGRFNSFKV